MLFGVIRVNADTANLQQNIVSGSLTMNLENSQVTFANVNVGELTNSDAELDNMFLSDLRGNAGGWSVTSYSDPLNLNASESIPNSKIKWKLDNWEVTGFNGATNTEVEVGAGNNQGLNQSENIIYAAAGNGAGEFMVNNAALSILIDTTYNAGAYSGTLTINIA